MNILPILGIYPKNRFYDFHSKYTSGMTELKVMDDLPQECYRSLCVNATRFIRYLGLEDVCGSIFFG